MPLTGRDTSTEFYGGYASGKVPGVKAGWDVYWLGLDRAEAACGPVTGREKRHTVGSRISGKIATSDFD